jgi:hypothetical protein
MDEYRLLDLQELNGLEALEYQMARSLDDLRHRHATGKFSSTFRGRLFNFGGRLFAAYCFVRLISVRPTAARTSSQR